MTRSHSKNIDWNNIQKKFQSIMKRQYPKAGNVYKFYNKKQIIVGKVLRNTKGITIIYTDKKRIAIVLIKFKFSEYAL